MKTIFYSAIFLLSASVAFAQGASRSFEPVIGDVYRFQNNTHYALVVTTDEGTVVVDPLNTGAATWLKENLSSITDQPVTHLIYSHSHFDHASGGSVFEQATSIAHENAPATIDGVTPTLRIEDELTLEVGGKTLELTYLGPGHGDDMIAVVVRPENVGFIVDIAAPERLPFSSFGGASSIDAWIEQIRKAESLDFEILAPGHGRIGQRSDLALSREYIEKLRVAVLEGLNAGKSVERLIDELTMDEYAHWQQYDAWRSSNIRGMASYLQSAGFVTK